MPSMLLTAVRCLEGMERKVNFNAVNEGHVNDGLGSVERGLKQMLSRCIELDEASGETHGDAFARLVEVLPDVLGRSTSPRLPLPGQEWKATTARWQEQLLGRLIWREGLSLIEQLDPSVLNRMLVLGFTAPLHQVFELDSSAPQRLAQQFPASSFTALAKRDYALVGVLCAAGAKTEGLAAQLRSPEGVESFLKIGLTITEADMRQWVEKLGPAEASRLHKAYQENAQLGPNEKIKAALLTGQPRSLGPVLRGLKNENFRIEEGGWSLSPAFLFTTRKGSGNSDQWEKTVNLFYSGRLPTKVASEAELTPGISELDTLRVFFGNNSYRYSEFGEELEPIFKRTVYPAKMVKAALKMPSSPARHLWGEVMTQGILQNNEREREAPLRKKEIEALSLLGKMFWDPQKEAFAAVEGQRGPAAFGYMRGYVNLVPYASIDESFAWAMAYLLHAHTSFNTSLNLPHTKIREAPVELSPGVSAAEISLIKKALTSALSNKGYISAPDQQTVEGVLRGLDQALLDRSVKMGSVTARSRM